MTAPVPKRADQLVVGDRIQPGYLPAYARSGEGLVMLVDPYAYRGADWVFVAFACADGDRNCAHYLPDGEVRVVPADDGFGYSRADDGETTQPIAGRVPAHLENARTGEVVMVGPGIARHCDASDVGTADCACGESFGTVEALNGHIARANAGGLVDETPGGVAQ